MSYHRHSDGFSKWEEGAISRTEANRAMRGHIGASRIASQIEGHIMREPSRAAPERDPIDKMGRIPTLLPPKAACRRIRKLWRENFGRVA